MKGTTQTCKVDVRTTFLRKRTCRADPCEKSCGRPRLSRVGKLGLPTGNEKSVLNAQYSRHSPLDDRKSYRQVDKLTDLRKLCLMGGTEVEMPEGNGPLQGFDLVIGETS